MPEATSWSTPDSLSAPGHIRYPQVAAAVAAALPTSADPNSVIVDVRPLADAGPTSISFIDNKKYLSQLDTTKAGACLVVPAVADRVPAGTVPLITNQPYHGFARALTLFYPSSLHPMVATAGAAPIDPTAHLEQGVLIEPGAVIGREAQIGSGTRIAAGAVIGTRVTIGRNCFIGPLATVTHALVGDRVTIHSGVRIGQDGFGFAMGRSGHLKVPQIGRVIIQDDVEIGANTTIDRGALKDTIIGEGTKIDNLVQIAHNVIIGRHCVIVAMSGISGSTELGDFRRHGRSIRNCRAHQNRQRRSNRRSLTSDARRTAGRSIFRHPGEVAARIGTGTGHDQAARRTRQRQL